MALLFLIFLRAAFALTWQAVALAAAIAILLGAITYLARTATAPAALAGSLICACLSLLRAHPTTPTLDQILLRSGLTSLIVLFILTASATRIGYARKKQLGVAESSTGRTALQVLANLFFAGAALALPAPWSLLIAAAVIAECVSDTLASEIGEVIGGTPFLITTFARAPAGTDGAISLGGSIAALIGAAAIAATATWSFRQPLGFAVIICIAGFAGCIFDSLLGATVERRGLIGNNAVNLASTAFAAAIACALAAIMG
jgi:uncharacterized protein (TIGR00297 family)